MNQVYERVKLSSSNPVNQTEDQFEFPCSNFVAVHTNIGPTPLTPLHKYSGRISFPHLNDDL